MKKELAETFKGLTPKTRRGMIAINLSIIDLIIRSGGVIAITDIERKTGLINWSSDLVRNILQSMASYKYIRAKSGNSVVGGNVVVGNMEKLTAVIEQQKTVLPMNHNKLWSDNDIEKLAEMKNRSVPNSQIAIELKRTENSIKKKCNNLREGYMLIPIIERSKEVRLFCEDFASPKPV